MDFTLPPLIFLLGYVLLTVLTGRRRIALFGAFILVLFPHISRVSILLNLGTAFFRMLKTFKITEMLPALRDAHAYHSGYSRPINPQLTFIFLQAVLLFFLRHLRTDRRRHLGLAIFFGIILSYSYIYFSSYLYLFWAVFAAINIFLRQYSFVKSTVIALSATLICSVPFWWSTFGFSESEITQVTVMTKTHAPIITAQEILTILLILCLVILLMLSTKPVKSRFFN